MGVHAEPLSPTLQSVGLGIKVDPLPHSNNSNNNKDNNNNNHFIGTQIECGARST